MSKHINSNNAYRLRSNPPAILTVVEAAHLLSISERKLREEIALCQIVTVRIGRRILIRLQDVEKYLERNLV